MSKNKGLGMGLEALLKMNVSDDELPLENSTLSNKDKNEHIVAGFAELPLEKILPNPNQPRKNFNEEALNELAQSIKHFGLIQPITVIKSGDNYEIIAGERRYRASKIAGLSKVPVIIKNLSLKEKLEVSLVENIQRENLNPIEEALAYSSLIEAYSVTQEELAGRLGKSRTAITNTMRLLNLDVQIKSWLMEGKITPGHARAILSVENEKSRLTFAEYIISNELSVRDAENLAKNWPPKKSAAALPKKLKKSVELRDVEKSLEAKLQTKVFINGSANKGKIEVSYFTEEELERIAGFLLEK